MKIYHCRDAGFDCSQIIRGTTEEEVLKLAADHSETRHRMNINRQLLADMRRLIRDEKATGSEESSGVNYG